MTERIYYTGDMANQSGWFAATPMANGNVRLVEEEGGEDRDFVINRVQVGSVYQGHCNPRFVTEAAVQTYRAAIMARMEEDAARFRARA